MGDHSVGILETPLMVSCIDQYARHHEAEQLKKLKAEVGDCCIQFNAVLTSIWHDRLRERKSNWYAFDGISFIRYSVYL